MSLTAKEIIIKFEELKKKFGDTKEFKKYEQDYGHDIDFIKFKVKHKLRWTKKTGWNKPFYTTTKNIWIKDRKNYNKGLRKYGYYQTIQTGWKLGESFENSSRCKWCGKILGGKEKRFCSTNDGIHRKLYSKIMSIGKKRHGFDLNKNYHVLIIPKLYEYDTSPSGRLIVRPTGKKRIEFKDIEFVINGKRYPLTKKSRTI